MGGTTTKEIIGMNAYQMWLYGLDAGTHVEARRVGTSVDLHCDLGGARVGTTLTKQAATELGQWL